MDADMSPETDTRDRVIRSEGKIDYLVKAFEDFVKESKESRSRMYRELEDARSNATSIKLEMEDLKEKFDKAHLTIVAIEKWKERAIGAGILIALIFGAIGGAMGLFWKWIATKLGI